MARECKEFKNLEKRPSFDKFSANKNRFFKIMIGDFENELKIPLKFVKSFKGQFPKECFLIGPSKKKWVVSVEEIGDRLVFSNDWDKFVNDHDLNVADLLVFRFVGDSCFKVIIFDASGCEKEYPSNISKGKEKRAHKVDDNDQFNQEGEGGNGKEGCDFRQIETSRGKPARKKFYISNRRNPTIKEKQSANFNAIRLCRTTGLPKVEITMLRSHVYNGFHLTIPNEWALEHMVRVDHHVELRVANDEQQRKWKVGCRWTPSQCQIRAKWPKFVMDNNLEKDDVCVFELILKGDDLLENKTSLMQVHIFRAIPDEIVPLTVSRQ